MSQKYYVDNLISRFIKCLLNDTYLPLTSVWQPNTSLIKDFVYVTYDRWIVKAKKDFRVKKYLGDYSSFEDLAEQVVSSKYYYATVTSDSKTVYYIPTSQTANGWGSWIETTYDNVFGPKNGQDLEYFERCGDYVFGENYEGITANFKSNSVLYDSKTHFYLGEYLRAYRDILGIDLMPFYNCLLGDSFDNIRIGYDYSEKRDNLTNNNSLSDGKVVYMANIKFNKNYTIYAETKGVPFRIKPCYYDGVYAMPFENENGDEIQSEIVRNATNRQPYLFNAITYNGDGSETTTLNKVDEKLLVLLIEVPMGSTITILEGDYTHKKSYITEDSMNRLSQDFALSLDEQTIEKFFAPISSLPLERGENYAFNDRLVEYLLYAPIISKDRIKNNIERIQKEITSKKALEIFGEVYLGKYVKDMWDTNLRWYIYDLITQKIKVPLVYDINGYVDKDVEYVLDKAKSSSSIDYDV